MLYSLRVSFVDAELRSAQVLHSMYSRGFGVPRLQLVTQIKGPVFSYSHIIINELGILYGVRMAFPGLFL